MQRIIFSSFVVMEQSLTCFNDCSSILNGLWTCRLATLPALIWMPFSQQFTIILFDVLWIRIAIYTEPPIHIVQLLQICTVRKWVSDRFCGSTSRRTDCSSCNHTAVSCTTV